MTDATARTAVQGRRPGPRPAARRRRRRRIFKPVALNAKRARRNPRRRAHDRAVQRGRHRARHRSEAEGRSGDLQRALGPPGQAGRPAATHIYNGAVDNASGTAALLAMAQEAVQATGQAQPDVPVGGGRRTGPAGQRGLRGAPLWPAEQNRGQPESRQPELRRPPPSDIERAAAASAPSWAPWPPPPRRRWAWRSAPPSRTWPAATSAATTSLRQGRRARVLRRAAAATRSRTRPPNDAKRKAYGEERYHQVTDEYDPSWDMAAWCSRRSSR